MTLGINEGTIAEPKLQQIIRSHLVNNDQEYVCRQANSEEVTHAVWVRAQSFVIHILWDCYDMFLCVHYSSSMTGRIMKKNRMYVHPSLACGIE